LITTGCSISHKEKARQYPSRAPDELKKSVEDNTSDKKLQEEFHTLAKVCPGGNTGKGRGFSSLSGNKDSPGNCCKQFPEDNRIPQEKIRISI